MPTAYLTVPQTAELLQVAVPDVLQLIDEGRLRAVRIGADWRVPETALDRLAEAPPPRPAASPLAQLPLGAGERWCPTFAGRKDFRVRGGVAEGAVIWPGPKAGPMALPKSFFTAMLREFAGQTLPIGMEFRRADTGTLGRWVQDNLPTRMNPTCYIAGLLVTEGYAEKPPERGYIRFLPARRMPKA
jgi:excisionase family DNA binding protein